MTWSRRLTVYGLTLVAAGTAMTLAARSMVDSLLYHPEFGSRREPSGLVRIPTPEGGTLAALYLPNPDARHVLWFFHGNAEDLGDIEPFLQNMRRQGFAVFAFDYPGYGLSTGKPSESALYAATTVAARYLQERLGVPLSRVVVYGRSLGGGPAVELAVREPVAGLALQAAFMSVYRVVTRWRLLPFDQFENLRKMPRVKCPVLVMHGRNDEVIGFAHGEALFSAAPGRKAHLWIDGAQHNDFTEIAGDRLWRALREFSGLCAAPAAR